MIPDPVRELLDLAAVHAFYIALLEDHLGHPIPVPHEIGQATVAERAVQSASTLKRWLDLLDMAIAAPMVRDALKESTTHETAEALLRYYVLKRSKADSDREKADFVATFLYRSLFPGPPLPPEPEQPRPMLSDENGEVPAEPAPPFEKELYEILGDVEVAALPEEHRQLVREFHFIRQEVDDFRHFDELMDSGIMQRVREIKQSFGDSLYHPRVLATLAEYNVFFGSRFDELFHNTTCQIRSFAAKVQQEGGSIMSRVDGDVIVKHLAEVEEAQIMQTEYGRAQETFRKISKFKKAVDSRGTVHTPGSVPLGPAPAAATPPTARTSLEAPFRGGKDMIEESKIQGVEDSIRNFVRAADPESSRVVPLRHGNISLTLAEAEAFRSDYGTEKSFRADYAAALRLIVTLQARLMAELEDYRAKHKSAYLWKPHADSLGYLLRASEHAVEMCGPLAATAQQRGLTDKVNSLNASLQNLRMQSQLVAKTLEGMA